MRVGVTGGSGFIGSHIVDKLREAGHNVTVLDLLPSHRNDVESVKVDILDIYQLSKTFKDLDMVYHLAGVANVNVALKAPIDTIKLNALGTASILEAARLTDLKRVILASSIWVYGITNDVDVSEETLFNVPLTNHIYTSSKLCAELFCHDYKALYGQKFTILRYGIPYGPRARPGAVIQNFVEKAMKKEPIEIYGDGSQHRPFIYVEDLAEGNVAALQTIAENKVYNIAGKKEVTVREVADAIQKIFPGTKVVYKDARPGDYKGKTISSEKAKRELGWEPKVELEDGIKRYVSWLKSSK